MVKEIKLKQGKNTPVTISKNKHGVIPFEKVERCHGVKITNMLMNPDGTDRDKRTPVDLFTINIYEN